MNQIRRDLGSQCSIVVKTEHHTDYHRLICPDNWQPLLVDQIRVGFIDDLVGTAVQISVTPKDGPSGFLVPVEHRCPLCHDHRQIAVWKWVYDNPIYDGLIHHDLLDESEPEGGFCYQRMPCPVCSYVEYELSRHDYADGSSTR